MQLSAIYYLRSIPTSSGSIISTFSFIGRAELDKVLFSDTCNIIDWYNVKSFVAALFINYYIHLQKHAYARTSIATMISVLPLAWTCGPC